MINIIDLDPFTGMGLDTYPRVDEYDKNRLRGFYEDATEEILKMQDSLFKIHFNFQVALETALDHALERGNKTEIKYLRELVTRSKELVTPEAGLTDFHAFVNKNMYHAIIENTGRYEMECSRGVKTERERYCWMASSAGVGFEDE